MTEAAAHAALQRLDRALARVERLARGRIAATAELAQANSALGQRHDALRARVQETIDKLDGLIADARATEGKP